MLERATAKFPDVAVLKHSLQELGDVPDVQGFDGLTCVDAMESIGPEDWPIVLAGFRRVLRIGGLAYISIELLDDADAVARDTSAAPLVEGEYFLASGGYHYFPSGEKVDVWLREAGFAVVRDEDGDGYRHVLVSWVSWSSACGRRSRETSPHDRLRRVPRSGS